MQLLAGLRAHDHTAHMDDLVTWPRAPFRKTLERCVDRCTRMYPNQVKLTRSIRPHANSHSRSTAAMAPGPAPTPAPAPAPALGPAQSRKKALSSRSLPVRVYSENEGRTEQSQRADA